jgi:hypothetical protein
VSLANRLLEVYRSVLGERRVIYLSTPIATGQRLTEFKNAGYTVEDHPKEFANFVIFPNKKTAREIADEVRRQYPTELFLNPAELGKFDHWSNDDYNNFAVRVIENFAREIWFLPGWEDSVGCRIEKELAEKLKLPIRIIGG